LRVSANPRFKELLINNRQPDARGGRAVLIDHCNTLEIVPPTGVRITVEPPDLPELNHGQLDSPGPDGDLIVDRLLVESQTSGPVRARHVRVTESELHGVVIDAGDTPGLQLGDVVLRACDLSNVDGREGSLRRVQIHGSRLVGFGLAGGTIQDLRVVDSTLALTSLAFSKLRNVVFERVDLTEAAFMEARLDGVEFIDCKLVGADFRGAEQKGCALRGTPIDGILGTDWLKGVLMTWADVLESAPALAAALGIIVESD
jgi:uncharacterized protein YjbI with pentapeptide repeats